MQCIPRLTCETVTNKNSPRAYGRRKQGVIQLRLPAKKRPDKKMTSPWIEIEFDDSVK